jgi:hypothetical protein
MHVETTWRKQAIQQFEQLPTALQHAALTLEQNLIANPYIGSYAHTVTLRDGTLAYVHVYAGISVVVEFYRRGLFRRTTVIVIHAVRPMDWPDLDTYETRRRR